MTATVAIIGRPNVGKSTLFNRLVGKRLALVDDRPGVTRDRREGDARIADLKFRIIDTAGLEDAPKESLEGRMRMQTEMAIREATVSLFLIDARIGLTPLDKHFAALLRKENRPVILVANKAEGRAGESGLLEALELGFGDAVPMSAEHGEGISDLYHALKEALESHNKDDAEEQIIISDDDEETDEDRLKRPLKVAIVGRPNAGKSTLVNYILGEERMLTGPEAGITRDTISVDWELQGRKVRLFDTAGMRKKARVQEKLEKLSVADALRAVRYAEVAVLLLDANTPFEKQDLQIADLVIKEGRALVIGLNKWDMIEDRQETLKELRLELERLLPQIRGVDMITMSGLQGDGIRKLEKAILKAEELWNKRISTSALNRWLDGVLAHHPPPAVSGRRIKIRYMTQVKSRPPSFVLFCSKPENLPTSYTRYLTNSLRDKFGLDGVPIRMATRKGDNPYAPRNKR
jgi:GTP-binding protein